MKTARLDGGGHRCHLLGSVAGLTRFPSPLALRTRLTAGLPLSLKWRCAYLCIRGSSLGNLLLQYAVDPGPHISQWAGPSG